MVGRVLRVAMAVAVCLLVGAAPHGASAQQEPQRYVRYSYQGSVAYGVVQGEVVRQLDGPPYASPAATGVEVPLADITLLALAEPSKVIAVGLNYLSHLGGSPPSEYPLSRSKLPASECCATRWPGKAAEGEVALK